MDFVKFKPGFNAIRPSLQGFRWAVLRSCSDTFFALAFLPVYRSTLVTPQHQLCSNRDVNVDWLCPVSMSAESSWRDQPWQEQDEDLALLLLCDADPALPRCWCVTVTVNLAAVQLLRRKNSWFRDRSEHSIFFLSVTVHKQPVQNSDLK